MERRRDGPEVVGLASLINKASGTLSQQKYQVTEYETELLMDGMHHRLE
jgi:hypothetical protein